MDRILYYEKREYEVKKFEENITIPPNAIRAIDFNLQEGEEFEVGYV